jgi:hypothetical protein
MTRRSNPRPMTPPPARPPVTPPQDLRERILADFAALKMPVNAEQFDAVLARAAREGLSHQQFLHLQAIREARSSVSSIEGREMVQGIKDRSRQPCESRTDRTLRTHNGT